jgi:hypothetical protein
MFFFLYLHIILIDFFTVVLNSRSRNFQLRGDITIAGEGLRLGLWPLSMQGGIFIVPHLL